MHILCSVLLLAIVGTSAAAESASPSDGAAFPTPFNTEKTPGGPMPATESAARIALPAGFHATVFAGEPDVRQPIAMATDSRGRLWVAENYTYSERPTGFNAELRDRIVIFEDTDHDGRFDKHTVFWEGAHQLTSIELGFGGVWALCLPQLLFIPDRDGDDRPDGPPEVLLDGFDYVHARHNVANGLRWGPDGWLYGRQGILANSLVGAPGAPEGQRTSMGAAIWRFHPRRHVFEIVAEGTTNPWGMDWDARGDGFFINTVIGHLWQLIPGAHYRRMFGPDRNPHVYELIEQHADHVHWATGEAWTDVRQGVTTATSASGGGHAHVGLLIYQGGNWPSEWDGKLLTNNFHGRRVNVERLEPEGSAIIGHHEPDAFQFADTWFRGLDLIPASDGGVFISDWSDAGECHDNDGIHRTSGRIFKLAYGENAATAAPDLRTMDEAALAGLQRSKNDWLARQSRRVLADRAAAGVPLSAAHAVLRAQLQDHGSTVERLRALWSLHVSDGLSRELLRTLLADPDEYIRTWAVRLLTDNRAGAIEPSLPAELSQLAERDASASVRLALASALQRVSPSVAAAIARPLLGRSEDAADHNLPLMLWYGIERLASETEIDFISLVARSRLPLVTRLAARRVAEDIETAPARLNALLAVGLDASPAFGSAVLQGIAEGLAGRAKASQPARWDEWVARFASSADQAVANHVRDLSALFGDRGALAKVRAVALDETADATHRKAALQLLVDLQPSDLSELCTRLLREPDLALTAVGGLVSSNHPMAADAVLAAWKNFRPADHTNIVGMMIARPTWALKLLDAVASGRIDRSDISIAQARQIRSFNDPALTAKLAAAWGRFPGEALGASGGTIATWQRKLTPTVLAHADLAHGHALFQGRCAVCHRLNGEGAAIGPDLTGAARDNLGYLLENIIDPNAVVPDEFRLRTLTLKDGRVLAGIVRERSVDTVTLQSLAGPTVVALPDVAKEETSAVSLMPPGLLDDLSTPDARDLFGYLMSRSTASR